MASQDVKKNVLFPITEDAFDAINVIHLIYHHLHIRVLTAGTFRNAHVSEPCKVTVTLGKEHKWRASYYVIIPIFILLNLFQATIKIHVRTNL